MNEFTLRRLRRILLEVFSQIPAEDVFIFADLVESSQDLAPEERDFLVGALYHIGEGLEIINLN